MKTNKSIFNYFDCIRIFIPDLKKGLEYYHHKVGLQIAWKTDNAIGLLMNDSKISSQQVEIYHLKKLIKVLS